MYIIKFTNEVDPLNEFYVIDVTKMVTDFRHSRLYICKMNENREKKTEHPSLILLLIKITN